MTKPPPPRAPTASEFLVYTGEDGSARVQVRLSEGTVWLTQRLIRGRRQSAFPRAMRTTHAEHSEARAQER